MSDNRRLNFLAINQYSSSDDDDDQNHDIEGETNDDSCNKTVATQLPT